MLLHALYERLCTAPLNRLPCYGALKVIVTLLFLLLLSTRPAQLLLLQEPMKCTDKREEADALGARAPAAEEADSDDDSSDDDEDERDVVKY